MKDTGKFLFLDAAAEGMISDAAPLCTSDDARQACEALVRSLADTGYDPVTQLAAYLIADDPTYLPEETEARAIARRVGRDKLLEHLLTFYMEHLCDAD